MSPRASSAHSLLSLAACGCRPPEQHLIFRPPATLCRRPHCISCWLKAVSMTIGSLGIWVECLPAKLAKHGERFPVKACATCGTQRAGLACKRFRIFFSFFPSVIQSSVFLPSVWKVISCWQPKVPKVPQDGCTHSSAASVDPNRESLWLLFL